MPKPKCNECLLAIQYGLDLRDKCIYEESPKYTELVKFPRKDVPINERGN